MSTLVIQSHRTPLPHTWLEDCLDSVKNWAKQHDFDYRFLDDELFEPVASDLLHKTSPQPVVATDLARLYWMRNALDTGYERAIWCDADFLVIDSERFIPVDDSYALGREVWIQSDGAESMRCYSKVHNAFLMFQRSNPFLDFYIDSAERLIRLNQGRMPPQYIGPKLLTALHNIVHCPVQEDAAMFSPMVLRDLAKNGGPALGLFLEKSPAPARAANLCSSVWTESGLDSAALQSLISDLIESKSLT